MDDLPPGTTYPRGFPGKEQVRWEFVPARALFELRYGKALTAAKRKPGCISVYGTNGPCGQHERALFEGPGVILGRKGQGPLGVEWSPNDYWVIDTAYSLELLSTRVNLRFAYYLISYIGLNHLKDGTSNPSLSRDVFGAQALPIPPLPEQSKIVDLLSALDDKIELNRRTNETLEALARAIFRDWFVDFGPTRAKAEGREPYLAPELWDLFPDRLDAEGKPEGWHIGELQEIIEVNPKEPLKKGTPAPYHDMASLPTMGPIPEPPVMREYTSGMRFRNGDALLARITPCLENGKTAFVQSLPGGVVGWGSTEFIVLRARPPVPDVFSYLLARDEAFRTHAIQSMTGTSGRQRARNEALATYAITLPNEPVWIAFAGFVEPLFAKVKWNGCESRTLAQTRDLLLPKLMSGEIRLKDAGKMAEALL
jgi:type I restriction enzyme S subunit